MKSSSLTSPSAPSASAVGELKTKTQSIADLYRNCCCGTDFKGSWSDDDDELATQHAALKLWTCRDGIEIASNFTKQRVINNQQKRQQMQKNGMPPLLLQTSSTSTSTTTTTMIEESVVAESATIEASVIEEDSTFIDSWIFSNLSSDDSSSFYEFRKEENIFGLPPPNEIEVDCNDKNNTNLKAYTILNRRHDYTRQMKEVEDNQKKEKEQQAAAEKERQEEEKRKKQEKIMEQRRADIAKQTTCIVEIPIAKQKKPFWKRMLDRKNSKSKSSSISTVRTSVIVDRPEK